MPHLPYTDKNLQQTAPRPAFSPLSISTQSLPPTSLGYALANAAQIVAAVQDGHNATECFERMRTSPAWTDASRGAIRDLAWNTLRDYGHGDAIVSQLTSKPLPTLIHALLLTTLSRLRHRPEQAHTIVHQAVAAATVLAPGLKGVVNGVLRNAIRRADEFSAAQENNLVARHAYPEWWIQRIRAQHPAEWESILALGNAHPPMSLRVNRRKISLAAYLDTLAAAGIHAHRLPNDALRLEQPLPVSRLPGFADGLVSVQDAGAQWAAPWLAPRDGERVLDACAAPGGKSAHLLELADIKLTALELDPVRARRIRDNLSRLGLKAEIEVADCTDLKRWWDRRPFDRILADLPCSGSGVVRRHPDIKWLRREKDIAQFSAQQAQILNALWSTLAPHGTMLYVTCSIFEQENRQQIERFLARHPDAKQLTPTGPAAPRPLLPTLDHDGFFYALLEKGA
ncbi:ribosomal RNA small subunit methyltransferase B [Betaproteobacteria bacterium]|nr:ribosomal RNA small subunit methyltransferase B [Betaproteobacteria bacterium]